MNKKVFIIAEAGVNHNGSVDIAKKLIDVASKSGADAVKFQTFKTENCISKNAEKAQYQKDNTTSLESQYEMVKKLELDTLERNIEDLEKFKGVNAIAILQSSKASNVKHEELHKKLYSATQRPTDVYNTKLADLVESIKSWDESIDKADKANDQKAKEMAEAHRNELSINLEELKGFKSGLSKFVSVYTYIAQLIELRDPELENFAAFAKLLAKRLDGVSVERVDLSGLVLSGYAIKENKEQIEAEGDTLKPLSAGGLTPQEREKEFLEEILKQLNEVFGEFGDDTLKKNFTSEILIKISEDEIVSEQINKNTKEQAMEGDLRNLVEEALISSRGIRDKMTKMLLGDEQNMERFLGLLIDGHKKDIVNKLNIL